MSTDRLHIEIEFRTGVSRRTVLNWLSATPNRVNRRVASQIAAALVELGQPVPDHMAWYAPRDSEVQS